MKKKIFFLAFAATTVFGMNAQLSVLKSGNVRIGSILYNVGTPIKATPEIVGPTYPSSILNTDSLATLNLLGTGFSKSGAYITFGDEKKVGIGELKSSVGDTDILRGVHGNRRRLAND